MLHLAEFAPDRQQTNAREHLMGLDILEYVIAIGEAIALDHPDADLARSATPAELIKYLCARLGETAEGPPLV